MINSRRAGFMIIKKKITPNNSNNNKIKEVWKDKGLNAMQMEAERAKGFCFPGQIYFIRLRSVFAFAKSVFSIRNLAESAPVCLTSSLQKALYITLWQVDFLIRSHWIIPRTVAYNFDCFLDQELSIASHCRQLFSSLLEPIPMAGRAQSHNINPIRLKLR